MMPDSFAATAEPLPRFRRSYFVKRASTQRSGREARFADDARPSASPRGERARERKGVPLSDLVVCEIRFDRLTILSRVEGRTTLHEQRDPTRDRRLDCARDPEFVEGRRTVMNHAG